MGFLKLVKETSNLNYYKKNHCFIIIILVEIKKAEMEEDIKS